MTWPQLKGFVLLTKFPFQHALTAALRSTPTARVSILSSCQETSATNPKGTIRFVMVALLWNIATAAFQCGHYCLTRPLASTGLTQRQRANSLFQKSLELYQQVVSFCNDAGGSPWVNRPRTCVFLTLAAMNNISCVCLELDMESESRQAQTELANQIKKCAATESGQLLSTEQTEAVNEFSLNTTVLSMSNFTARAA
ncbi:expressed unknown protein [Seminavis robusta]|uniref:Uncharacterized protein n=1 Tax=Seminavis robusta TaxID=568900 RepID=A0A9N8H690_9STRA|nr:expressed unknown protein [Seminavis robusta]|eukprot:Sro39_g024080.1 n/a (198) ;mRNA; r:54690-55283